MGTENLFHKRKAKTTAALKRRELQRAPYAKVLIVREGEKTEPNYFQGLRVAELNSTDNPSTRVHLLVDFLQNIKTPS